MYVCTSGSLYLSLQISFSLGLILFFAFMNDYLMTEFYLLISQFNCLLLFIIIPRNCHLLLLLIHINDEKGFFLLLYGTYELL